MALASVQEVVSALEVSVQVEEVSAREVSVLEGSVLVEEATPSVSEMVAETVKSGNLMDPALPHRLVVTDG